MLCCRKIDINLHKCGFSLYGWILKFHQCYNYTLEGAKLMYDVSICSRPSWAHRHSPCLSLSLSLSLTVSFTHTSTHTLCFFCSSSKNNSNWAFLLSSNSAKGTYVFSQPPVLDAQFSFDKCDVSVKLLMVLQDSASQTSKGIH